MDSYKQKYDFFIAQGQLTEESFADLVRLCGFAPTNSDLKCDLPATFNDFLEMLPTFKNKVSQKDLNDQLVSLCGGNTISREELLKILYSGDKLSDEEVDDFLRLINVENGYMSVSEITDLLYNEEQ